MNNSFTVTTNRIAELRNTLKLLQDSRHKQESLKPAAETSANVFLVEAMKRAPVGRVEPNYSIRKRDGKLFTISHGRPSLRQHGATLRQGWVQPDIQPTSKGVSFAIRSVAPQIAILLTGSPRHTIPTLTSFWWFAQGLAGIYSRIDHPGFPRNPFIDETVKVKRPFMLAKFREGVAAVMAPLRMFFKK